MITTGARLPDTITVRVTNVYGNVTYYPDCPTSKLFAEIAGTKTLTHDNIVRILNMGFAVDYTHDTVGVKLP